MATSQRNAAKPKGWHAFTAVQRGGEDPSPTLQEAFPSLSPSGQKAAVLNLNLGTDSKENSRRESFERRRIRSSSPPAVVGRLQGRGKLYQQNAAPSASPSSKNSTAVASPDEGDASWRWKIGRAALQADAMQRVKGAAPAADAALIGDLLEALQGNVEAAIAQLQEMGLAEGSGASEFRSGPASQKAEASTAQPTSRNAGEGRKQEAERNGLRRSSRSEGELSALHSEALLESKQGPDAFGRDVEDSYYKYRGEALRISRGRARHAKSAASAFTLGDHSRAKELSRLAREEGEVAQKLHMQAAEKILAERNADRAGGIWEVDLHGLHANEAVLALASRLNDLESEVSAVLNSPVGPSNGERSEGGSVRIASELPSFRKELMVITGLGNHSRGGPTLPSIVSSFLTENGYIFRQARAGVLAVRPKYRLLSSRAPRQ